MLWLVVREQYVRGMSDDHDHRDARRAAQGSTEGPSDVVSQEELLAELAVESNEFARASARPVDAARESARYQLEEEQAAQRRAHLLILERRLGRRARRRVPGC